jgi:DNA-binding NarL/FixJ family response regulator
MTQIISTLSETQVMILILSGEGWTQKEIADRMKIPFGTLRLQIWALNEKMGCKNVTQSVAKAVREKII